MSSDAPCAVPLPLSLDQALHDCAALASLRQRLAESTARFAAIRPVLPPDLRSCVSPGPVDGTGWTLLAPHASAAAKLRQCCPILVQALAERGWEGTSIKVRVQRP